MARSNHSEGPAALVSRLGITFHDQRLLTQALTHRSVLAETEGVLANERLEFLGDAVLDLIVAEALYRAYPDWPEGQLTKAKASMVEERSLEKIARQWDIGPYVIISHGEDVSGGRERRALLADAVEAIIGAYYLDQGLDACRAFVLREMAAILESIDRLEYEHDYKTQLQEAFQSRYQSTPIYAVVSESGPAHARLFQVEVSFQGEVIGVGSGRSKKAAEQQAAEQGLTSSFLVTNDAA